MKVLILAADYPDLNGNINLYYIHTRSKYYISKGIELEVLNFSAKECYEIDGIKVITLDEYKCNYINKKYNILILHAPNLRNHYRFLKTYGQRFDKYLFFFHGHEVLKINKDYSKPYSYVKVKNKILQKIYDVIKLKIWKIYFKRNIKKSYFIFVSNWMKEMFLKNTKIEEQMIKNHTFITYNSVGKEFQENNYDKEREKKYDFITIRGNLDGSKYCIDIINQLAFQNENSNFIIVGKGRYFSVFEKAPNIVWLNKYCNHTEIIELLNNAKCALMPTRTDAQGLMMCEMATFGIPMITSDISVCHEVLDSFNNVEFINNDNIEKQNIIEKYNTILNKMDNKKNDTYFLEKNCDNEIKIITKISNED